MSYFRNISIYVVRPRALFYVQVYKQDTSYQFFTLWVSELNCQKRECIEIQANMSQSMAHGWRSIVYIWNILDCWRKLSCLYSSPTAPPSLSLVCQPACVNVFQLSPPYLFSIQVRSGGARCELHWIHNSALLTMLRKWMNWNSR